MGILDLFSKKQKEANQKFLAQQRGQQAAVKIKKLDLPSKVKQQLVEAEVFDIWLKSKDLHPLVAVLSNSSETIQYAAIGINDQSQDVLLVCTDQHLVITTKTKLLQKINLSQVKSVLLKSQLVYDDLSLVVDNSTLDINSINKAVAAILAEKIKTYLQPKQDSADKIAQLKQLKELLDQGVLDEAEFKAEKKKILDN